jgi:hypothetical protein
VSGGLDVTIERIVAPGGGAGVDAERLRARLEGRLAEALSALAADPARATGSAVVAVVERTLRAALEAPDG